MDKQVILIIIILILILYIIIYKQKKEYFSSNIEYPIVALTSNNSIDYIVTRSSVYSSLYEAYNIFDKLDKNLWISQIKTYDNNTGNYIGSNSFNNINGEWVSIKMTYKIIPTAIHIGSMTSNQQNTPVSY